MSKDTMNQTALRLVVMGYSVDTEQFDATGFDVATLDGQAQTAEDIIRRLLDDRQRAFDELLRLRDCVGPEDYASIETALAYPKGR